MAGNRKIGDQWEPISPSGRRKAKVTVETVADGCVHPSERKSETVGFRSFKPNDGKMTHGYGASVFYGYGRKYRYG